MGGKNLGFFIGGLLIILIVGIVSASFTIGAPTHSIKTEYEHGEKVVGWVSIKLTNESNSTLFEDSEGNSITLIELINENDNFPYSLDSDKNISTTGFQDLYLDNGTFYLPSTIGTINYQLNFSGTEFFAEIISISLEAEGDVNDTLASKISALNTLKAEINSYNSFEQTSLNSALNIEGIEAELGKLSASYLSASTQAELDNISTSLYLINIPQKIEVTKTALSIPTFPKLEYIDLDTIESITNTSYEIDKENDYKTAILGWGFNNLNIKISFKEFSSSDGGVSKEFVVGTFDLEISKKTTLDYAEYIFLEKMNNTLFKQDYKEQEQGNYYVFEFTGDTEILSFSTTESVDFTNLVFFISPAMTELGVEDFEYEEGEENEKDLYEKKKWTIFILVIFLVLIVGLVLYLVLQTWYKRRYENYLFNNKNDLYNLANYITNSKKKGLDNDQIRDNLIKSRWSSEQIRYALRKYSGKRTGMYEIPLKRIEKKNSKGAPGYGYRGYSPK